MFARMLLRRASTLAAATVPGIAAFHRTPFSDYHHGGEQRQPQPRWAQGIRCMMTENDPPRTRTGILGLPIGLIRTPSVHEPAMLDAFMQQLHAHPANPQILN